ncbi:hypothetical protein ACTXT7_002716 [Hymenolepis weldensis]
MADNMNSSFPSMKFVVILRTSGGFALNQKHIGCPDADYRRMAFWMKSVTPRIWEGRNTLKKLKYPASNAQNLTKIDISRIERDKRAVIAQERANGALNYNMVLPTQTIPETIHPNLWMSTDELRFSDLYQDNQQQQQQQQPSTSSPDEIQ